MGLICSELLLVKGDRLLKKRLTVGWGKTRFKCQKLSFQGIQFACAPGRPAWHPDCSVVNNK